MMPLPHLRRRLPDERALFLRVSSSSCLIQYGEGLMDTFARGVQVESELDAFIAKRHKERRQNPRRARPTVLRRHHEL